MTEWLQFLFYAAGVVTFLCLLSLFLMGPFR